MTRVSWDAVGEHLYETGVDRGVLYLADGSGDYTTGFGWNGLTTVTKSPSGAEATKKYADNILYVTLMSIEEMAGTIEALTYPDEFAQCDGSVQAETGVYVGQQPRRAFGFSWRTRIGNDLSQEAGYKIHMVWNAMASPSEQAHGTVNESPETVDFSWEFWTTPTAFDPNGSYADLKPTSYLCVDSTKVDSADLATLEDLLYGTVGDDPSLPTPDAVLTLFASGPLTLATLPATIAYDSGTDLVTIPATTGVIYKIDGVTRAAGTWPITQDVLVTAIPAPGYYFAPTDQDEWQIVFA